MSPSRNAPLGARSVLASVLLGTDPPWLPTPLLVRTGGLFGITEGTVRTALSRMAATDEAEPRDGGYALAGHLVERQHRQAASRAALTRAWDGSWELATVDGDEARSPADRAALRDAMRTLRLAELREGLWGRPDNLDPARSADAAALVHEWCMRWTGARPAPAPDPNALWELDEWDDIAGDLRAEMRSHLGALEARDPSTLADGFVTSAAVLRHLQADPLLPAELLPDDWSGPVLRTEYDRYDAAYRATLRAWFDADR